MKRNRPLNQEKREAILTAAIEEFYTKGYDGSSMDTISKVANVSKATVYNHFKNKEELFFAIAEIFKMKFNESFQYDFDSNKSLQIQLTAIAHKEMQFLNKEENIRLIQILTVVMIQKSDIGQKLLEEFEDDCLIMTAQWFEHAKQQGLLKFDDATFVSRQFIGMIKTFAFYPQLYGAPLLSKDEQDHVIENAVQMILKLYAS